MDKFQCKRLFGSYYALELERMDAEKDWWQIKALPPVINHPMDLDHTRQNWHAGKMAVKQNKSLGAVSSSTAR